MGSFLTPDDTYFAWRDAGPMNAQWADVQQEVVGLRARSEDVRDWHVTLTDRETGVVYQLDHAKFLATMERIATDPSLQVDPAIVAECAEAVRASSHDAATDAMCQLDCVGFDVIVQLATLDTVIYG